MRNKWLIPWRHVKYWLCLGCGKCCRHYWVPINSGELPFLLKYYSNYLEVRKGKIYLKRRVDGSCVFLKNNLCTIQGVKPVACKTFPFYVQTSPLKKYKPEEAIFTFNSKKYFVYVDSSCEGLGLGFPVEKVIKEAIEILRGEKSQQFLTKSHYTLLKPKRYLHQNPLPSFFKERAILQYGQQKELLIHTPIPSDTLIPRKQKTTASSSTQNLDLTWHGLVIRKKLPDT